ncbi:MAG TPA: hypothetical protein VGD26_12495 [Chitinophagaceae bacterium]
MRLVLFIMVAVFFVACNEKTVAFFDEPQPPGGKTVDHFSALLQGDYVDKEQASILNINATTITRYFDFDLRMHKDSLDEDLVLKGDSLIDITSGEVFLIVRDSDYVKHHYRSETDTLFHIDRDHPVKKVKGHYFLNSSEGPGAWSVQKLSLHKGLLTLGSITDSIDLEKLITITGTASDTTPHHFSPTRKQFRKFVKEEGFSERDSFYRISSPL